MLEATAWDLFKQVLETRVVSVFLAVRFLEHEELLADLIKDVLFS